MMCAASIVFQPPQDTPSFSAEYLKLFAAEFAGSAAPTMPPVWALAEDLVGIAPADVVANVGDGPYKAATNRTKRQRLAWDSWQMLQALRQYLGARGLPLLTDLRASYSNEPDYNNENNKSQVWNQVIFKYELTFSEHQDSNKTHATEERRAQDLVLRLDLFANADHGLPTDEMPAQFVEGDVVMNSELVEYWSRRLRIRLQYTDDGNPADQELNECKECTDSKEDWDYYLPRYLAAVRSVSAIGGDGDGNPHVTLERLTDPRLGLQFNARYQPPFNEVLP